MQPIILCLPGGNGNRRTDLPYTKVVPVCGTPHIFEHGRHAGQDFSVHVSNEGHDTDNGLSEAVLSSSYLISHLCCWSEIGPRPRILSA